MSGIIGKTKASRSGIVSNYDHDSLDNFAANEHYTQANITATGTIASGTWEGTDVAVAHGGTGASTHTANNVLIGAGASAITSVAPGADGQVLTSTGTVWQSEAASGGGGEWEEITSGSMSEPTTIAFGDSHDFDVIKVYVFDIDMTDGHNLMGRARIGGTDRSDAYYEYVSWAIKSNASAGYVIESASADIVYLGGEWTGDNDACGSIEFTIMGGNNASMKTPVEWRAFYHDYYDHARRHNGLFIYENAAGKVQSLILSANSVGDIISGTYVALGKTI